MLTDIFHSMCLRVWFLPVNVYSVSQSSSTTSSRTTYTSTSSKHPLPPRPDWAVGLKAEPVLHATRHHHDHNSANSRNMSPARLGMQNQHQPQPVLQPNDFPPLSSAAERRTPTVAGAWTNASSTRSIIMANAQGNPVPQSNALVHYPNAQQPSATGSRMEDQDPGFDRPPPKDNVELFNPKGARRVPDLMRAGVVEVTAEFPKQKGLLKTEPVFAGLVDMAAGISLEDRPEDESALGAPQHDVHFPAPSVAGEEGPEDAGGS